MATGAQGRMNCPVHKPREMVPEEQRVPFLSFSLPGADMPEPPGRWKGRVSAMTKTLRRCRGRRIILRCPVPGCPRVEEAPESKIEREKHDGEVS